MENGQLFLKSIEWKMPRIEPEQIETLAEVAEGL